MKYLLSVMARRIPIGLQWIFSQAEHDENAQSILIAWDDDFLDSVYQSIAKLLPKMERSEIIAQSLPLEAL